MEIIIGRKGTQRIPITDMTVSREHCKLTVQSDGTMWLENLSANGTFVDGQSVLKKRVTKDTVIRLGATYQIALRDVLPLATSNRVVQQPQPSPRVSANPNPPQQVQKDYTREFAKLEAVYARYSKEKLEIQKEASQASFMRMLPMALLSLVSMGASLIPALASLSEYIAIIGVGLLVFSVVKMYVGSTKNPERMDALNNQFMIDYVCPECGCFLGYVPFQNLKNKGKCSSCKCKWV